MYLPMASTMCIMLAVGILCYISGMAMLLISLDQFMDARIIRHEAYQITATAPLVLTTPAAETEAAVAGEKRQFENKCCIPGCMACKQGDCSNDHCSFPVSLYLSLWHKIVFFACDICFCFSSRHLLLYLHLPPAFSPTPS